MRDGQSILEQAAVSGDGRIATSLVEEMLGLVGTEAAIDLVRAVVAEGMEETIRKFTSMMIRGADLKFLFLSLVDILRDAAVWKFTEQDSLLFRHSPSSLARVKDLCALRSREEWMFLLDIAFRSEKDVLATEFPRLGFELLLLRLVNAQGLLDVDGLAAAPPSGSGRPQVIVAEAPAARATQKPRTTVSKRSPAAAPPPRDGAVWEEIRRTLEEKKKPLLVALLHQMRGRLEGGEMIIACPHQMQLDRLREDDKWPALMRAVEEVVGSRIPIRLLAEPEKKSPADDESGGGRNNPEKRALADPLLAEVLREFEGATLLEVRPAPRRTQTPEAEDAGQQDPGEGEEELEEAE
jgi:hypothetical protein